MRLLLLILITTGFSQTICLNMIVKNEARVIERSLASVKEIIDYWVIVDTGSTDGTQQLILELLKDIPGELHERPWIDFAHNRNEALKLAKNNGDFVLFMDADEFLLFPKGKKKPPLDKEAYLFPYQNSNQTYTYYRIALIDNRLPWEWRGEIHESIESLLTRPKTHEYYKEIINVTNNDGKRSQDPKKTLKDAEVLKKMLEKNPKDSRAVFYLAQSYLNAANYDLALHYLEKRSQMGDCEQERFWALYQVGIVKELLKRDPQQIIDEYCKAYQFRPSRAEPLYQLARFYVEKENYTMGYIVAKQGLSIPLSNDFMYVENWIYDFGLALEFAHCAYSLGRYKEARETCLNILSKENLPPSVRERVKENLNLLRDP